MFLMQVIVHVYTSKLSRGSGCVVLLPEYAETSIFVSSSGCIQVTENMANESINMTVFYPVFRHTKGNLRTDPNDLVQILRTGA